MEAFTEAWRGMGYFKWPALGVIALGLILEPILGPVKPQWIDQGNRLIAEGTARLETKGNFRLGRRVDLRVFVGSFEPKHATAQFASGEETSINFSLEGEEWVAQTSLQAPAEVSRFQISVSMALGGGKVQSVTWDLGRPLSF